MASSIYTIAMADFVNARDDSLSDAFLTAENPNTIDAPSGDVSTIMAVINDHVLVYFKKNLPVPTDPYLVEKSMSSDHSFPDFRFLPPADEVDQEILRKSPLVCVVIDRSPGGIKLFVYVGSAVLKLRGTIGRIENYEDPARRIKYMGDYVQRAMDYDYEIEGIRTLLIIPNPVKDLMPKAQA